MKDISEDFLNWCENKWEKEYFINKQLKKSGVRDITDIDANQGWVCPKCGKVYAPWVSECSRCGVEKEIKSTPKLVPTVYGWSNVPSSCQLCSNHPSNGGSGICYCVLGTQTFC